MATTETFTTDTDWTVPSGVYSIQAEIKGGKGGDANSGGGYGGRIVGDYDATPGETLSIRFSPGADSSSISTDDTAATSGAGGSSAEIATVAGAGGGGGGGSADAQAPSQDGDSTSAGGDGGGGSSAPTGSSDVSITVGSENAYASASGAATGTALSKGDVDSFNYGINEDASVAGGGGGAGFSGNEGGHVDWDDDNDDVAAVATGGAGGAGYNTALTNVTEETGTVSGSAEVILTYTVLEVTNLSAVGATDTSIDLAWDGSSNAAEYEIYRDGSLVTTVTTTSYTDTGLSSGTYYDYEVVPISSSGGSGVSDTVTAGTGPSASVDAFGDTTITLSWETVSAATEYRVYRAQSSGGGTLSNYTQVATVTSESYQDTGLLNDVEYFYVVTAYDGSTESGASNEVSQTTTLPAVTDLATVDVRETEADLSWSNPENNATEKRVYVRRTGSDDSGAYERTGMAFDPSNSEYIDLGKMALSGNITIFARIADGSDHNSRAIFSQFNDEGVDKRSILFALRNGSDIAFATSNDGTWNYQMNVPVPSGDFSTTAVHDNGTNYIYTNGSEAGSSSPEETPYAADTPTLIGAMSDGAEFYFDSSIYEIALWGRPLSDAEITDAHNGNIPQDGLIAYWPLDLNRNGVTPDLSPYANHGTLPPNDFNGAFETLDGWEVNDGGLVTDRVYQGSYSFYGDGDAGSTYKARNSFDAVQPDTFSYVYQETTSGSGIGIRLQNSDGNYEGGTTSDNPEWDVDFANTSGQVHGGPSGNYDEWVSVDWDFDWANSQVTVSWEALSSGDTYSDTYTLKNGVDISAIEIWGYHAEDWRGSSLGWFDAIKLDGKLKGPTLTGPTVQEVSGGIPDGHSVSIPEGDNIGVNATQNLLDALSGTEATILFRTQYDPDLFSYYADMFSWTAEDSGGNQYSVRTEIDGVDAPYTRWMGDDGSGYWARRKSWDKQAHTHADVWDNGDIYNYTDGSVEVQDTAGTSTLATAVSVGSIRSVPYGILYDEFAIYGRALAQQEIQDYHNDDIIPSSPALYYSFDDSGVSTITDESGNGNDGTPTAGVEWDSPLTVNAYTNYTATGLLNGEEYEAYVHTVADDNEVRSL